MANLVKRENREVARSASPEYRLDPFRMMDALLRWDPFRGDRGGFNQNLDFIPGFDVKEIKDAFVIRADLPGVKDEDVQVSLSGNLLTISPSGGGGWAAWASVDLSTGSGFYSPTWVTPTPQHMRNGGL